MVIYDKEVFGEIMKDLGAYRSELLDPKMNIVFSFSLSFYGIELKERLIHTIQRVYNTLSMTKKRIALVEGNAYYEDILISKCSYEETADSLEDIYHKTLEPLDIFNGELLKIFFKEEKNCYDIVIVAHHLFGDGMAVVFFIDYFLKALADEKNTLIDFKMLQKKEIISYEPLDLFSSLYVKYLNRNNSCSKQISEEDYYHLYRVSNQKKYMVQSFTIPLDKLSLLLEQTKALHITFNSYFITKLFLIDASLRRIGIATSFRSDKCFSNEVSGIEIYNRIRRYKNLNANMKSIHRIIKKTIAKHPYYALSFMASLNDSLVDSIILDSYQASNNKIISKLSKLCGYSPNSQRDIGVSNLTRINLQEQYEHFKVHHFCFIPPITSYNRKTIGIVTDSNGCHVSLHAEDNEQNKLFFEKMRNAFC